MPQFLIEEQTVCTASSLSPFPAITGKFAFKYLVATLHTASCSRYSYKLYPVESYSSGSICTEWSKIIFYLGNKDTVLTWPLLLQKELLHNSYCILETLSLPHVYLHMVKIHYL